MKILIQRDLARCTIHRLIADKTQNVNLTLSYIKLFSTFVGESFCVMKIMEVHDTLRLSKVTKEIYCSANGPFNKN